MTEARRMFAGGIELDLDSVQIRIRDRGIPLPALQFEILRLLMQRPGEVVTTRVLIDTLWTGQDEASARQSMKAQIHRLRRLIESHPGAHAAIGTVRGEGYRLDVVSTPNAAASPPSTAEPWTIASAPTGSGRPVLSVSGVELDLDGVQLRSCSSRVDLTLAEFHFLRVLMTNAGRVMSPRSLIDEMWGPEPRRDTAILEEYVRRGRRRLSEVGAPPTLIRTVRNQGYVFDVAARTSDSPRISSVS